MNQVKRNGAKPAKFKKFAEQSLRRVALNNSLLTKASTTIHFKNNRRNQCILPRAVGSAKPTDISSLVVNKWSMPVSGPQIVPVVQPFNTTESSSKEYTGNPVIRNIIINGKLIPMKVLKIIPADQFNNSIRSSSDNAQESENRNGTSNLGKINP